MEISLAGYARNKGSTTNMVCTGDINHMVKERMVIFLNLYLNKQPINNFNNIDEHTFEVELLPNISFSHREINGTTLQK